MSRLVESPPVTTRSHARTAWWAVAVTPVVVALGVVGAFGGQSLGAGAGGVLVGIVCLLAPTVAVVNGLAAVRANERGATPVAIAAIALFVGCAVVLPLIAISGTADAVAVALALAVLGVRWLRRSRSGGIAR
jgi:hypothetical protein